MKIASLVPSWTETLLECGADVVARTRFCVHPKDKIAQIPSVGGTKQVDWMKLCETGADFLILDREENPKSIADESPIPFFASSIHSIDDLAPELRRLSAVLTNESILAGNINSVADRWQKISELAREKKLSLQTWSQLPGLIKWLREPVEGAHAAPREGSEILYVIWKNPWMAAAPQTFIGSVLQAVGVGHMQRRESVLYPEFSLSELDPLTNVLLLSSEPYPFAKRQSEALSDLPFPIALVDGEAFSWFGLRTLSFLEQFYKES